MTSCFDIISSFFTWQHHFVVLMNSFLFELHLLVLAESSNAKKQNKNKKDRQDERKAGVVQPCLHSAHPSQVSQSHSLQRRCRRWTGGHQVLVLSAPCGVGPQLVSGPGRQTMQGQVNRTIRIRGGQEFPPSHTLCTPAYSSSKPSDTLQTPAAESASTSAFFFFPLSSEGSRVWFSGAVRT